MNDEIKEILDRIETASEIFDCLLKPEECTELLDYITNLQEDVRTGKEINAELNQENERLKEIKPCMINFQECYVIKDYKSRCEKAIEYNNQIIKDTKDFYRPTTDIIYSGDCLIEIATNNINILQNGSGNE